MNKTNGMDWLALIATPDALRARMRARVHPVDTGEQYCSCIRIDDRWLLGQARALIFDSPTAARRFLSMVGISGEEGENVADLDVDCRRAKQCFHLSRMGGLGVCPKRKTALRPAFPPQDVRGSAG